MVDNPAGVNSSDPNEWDGLPIGLESFPNELSPDDLPGFDLTKVAVIDATAEQWLGQLDGNWLSVHFNRIREADDDVIARLTLAGLAEQRFGLTVTLETGEVIVETTVSGSYSEKLDEALNEDVPTCVKRHTPRQREIRLTHAGIAAKKDMLGEDAALRTHVFGCLRGFTPFTDCHSDEGVVRLGTIEDLSVAPDGDESIANHSAGGKAVQQEAHTAYVKKLFPKGLPRNQDLQDAIVKLDTYRAADTTDDKILRDFLGDDDKAVQKMKASIRTLRSQGRTTLPAESKRT